jgi:TPR repeat protein
LKALDGGSLPPGAVPQSSCIHDGECKARCFGGEIEACGDATFILLNRSESDQDGELLDLARNTCHRGSRMGCGVLATLFVMGRAGEDLKDEGWALMARACEMGESLSCESLGERAVRERPSSPDNVAGAQHYLRSCQLGNTRACMKAAASINDGGLDRPDSDPVRLYDRSCRAGYASACLLLGINYVRRNEKPDARAAFDRACRMGREEACTRLALLDVPRRGRGGHHERR